MKPYAVITIISLLVAGCAATGKSYKNYMASSKFTQQGKALIIVFRTKASSQYSGQAADISLDGNSLGHCDYAGFSPFEIEPGDHTLAASMTGSLGSCEIPIKVESSNTYYYEIKPRVSNFVSFLFFGYVGEAIETAVKECSGAVTIEPVDDVDATKKLIDLHQTI
jgi:hypothetical protein